MLAMEWSFVERTDRVRKVKDQAWRIYITTIAANEREDRILQRKLDVINGQQRQQSSTMQRCIKAAKMQQEMQIKRMRSGVSYTSGGLSREKKPASRGDCVREPPQRRRSCVKPRYDEVTRRSALETQKSAKGVQGFAGEVRIYSGEGRGSMRNPRSSVNEKQRSTQFGKSTADGTQKSTCHANISPSSETQKSADDTRMGSSSSKMIDIMEGDEQNGLNLNGIEGSEAKIDFADVNKLEHGKSISGKRRESVVLEDSVKYTETEVKHLKASFVGKRGQDAKKRRSIILPDLNEDAKGTIERRRRKFKRLRLKRRKIEEVNDLLEQKLNDLRLSEMAGNQTLPLINDTDSKI